MTLTDLLQNMKVILPLAVLIAWACILLLVDLFIPKGHKGWTAVIGRIGSGAVPGIEHCPVRAGLFRL